MTESHLQQMFERADRIDYREGLLAYERYKNVMVRVADAYAKFLPHRRDPILNRVVAAFVAMSPNNDYIGNLRSLISLCEGAKVGKHVEKITVSTYGHCKVRAWRYLMGDAEFLQEAKGLKIRNFYRNILDPFDNRYVTIDGHMVATFRNDPKATMKDSIINVREYKEIADAVKRLAFQEFLLPNQYQAVVWFTRKRVLQIRFDPQHDLFAAEDDVWRTSQSISDIRPFR